MSGRIDRGGFGLAYAALLSLPLVSLLAARAVPGAAARSPRAASARASSVMPKFTASQ